MATQMPCKGKNAKRALKRYGYRKDMRRKGLAVVLGAVARLQCLLDIYTVFHTRGFWRSRALRGNCACRRGWTSWLRADRNRGRQRASGETEGGLGRRCSDVDQFRKATQPAEP
jgi:hypothetical protein